MKMLSFKCPISVERKYQFKSPRSRILSSNPSKRVCYKGAKPLVLPRTRKTAKLEKVLKYVPTNKNGFTIKLVVYLGGEKKDYHLPL
jgi:hypothetical protein